MLNLSTYPLLSYCLSERGNNQKLICYDCKISNQPSIICTLRSCKNVHGVVYGTPGARQKLWSILFYTPFSGRKSIRTYFGSYTNSKKVYIYGQNWLVEGRQRSHYVLLSIFWETLQVYQTFD